MNKILFSISDVCTAFKDQAIGSKVLDVARFMPALEDAVRAHEKRVQVTMEESGISGQYFVLLPKEVYDTVSAGDGPKSDNPENYIVRNHREGPKMFLKRKCAGTVQFLAVVVYTRSAYLSDPDITEEEKNYLANDSSTHWIVAVIASSSPEAPVTPFRFVHNLAGGNNEYIPPSMNDYYKYAYDEHYSDLETWAEFIVNKARAVKDYWTNYSVVAD